MTDWPDPPINAAAPISPSSTNTEQGAGGGSAWPDPPVGKVAPQQTRSSDGWPDPPIGKNGPTSAVRGPPVGRGASDNAAVRHEVTRRTQVAGPEGDQGIMRGSSHATVQPVNEQDPWDTQPGFAGAAAMPFKQWYPTYKRMVAEGWASVSQSFNDLFHDKTMTSKAWDLTKVVGGTIATVASPISATYDSFIGGPVQGMTRGLLPSDIHMPLTGTQLTSHEGGVSREATDLVAGLAVPIAGEATVLGNGIQEAAATTRSAVSNIPKTSFMMTAKTALAPAGIDAASAETGSITRANWGQLARRTDQARDRLNEFSKAFAKMPQSEQLNFIHGVETGAKQATPELDQAAKVMRDLFDERYNEVKALGKHINYIEDYFPHLWKDVGSVDPAAQLAGKKPLLGSKEFLRQRTVPTTQDGIAKGLEPVTTNPVDLTLLKIKSMDRLIVGTHIVNELKAKGLLKFFKGGAPVGWREIDDPIAHLKYVNQQGELVLAGKLAAPENAARVINNHLSSSAIGGKAPLEWLRGAGNLMNMSQLSFSAFHGGFITFDAMASKTSLAVEQLAKGEFGRATKTYLGMPLAPITGLLKGRKLEQAWLNPGNATPELQQMADALEAGGGRLRMDTQYRATAQGSFVSALKNGTFSKEVKEAFRDNPWKAPLTIAARTIETTNAWLMDWYVPLQKKGVFYDMASDVLRRNPNMSQEEMRVAMQKAWDSVDNRMGQLVYDNLFWNKTLRDTSHLAVRAVGWTLGTIRELGGGGVDLVKSLDKFMAGDGFDITHRTAYLAGVTATTALVSSVTQYLYTGSGPTELRDYFFPRTGAKDPKYGYDERISPPTYMKDLDEYNRDPGGTLASKIHPMWKSAYEMMTNRDFFGAAIVNRDDPAGKQLADLGKYLESQYTPFNWSKSSKKRRPAGELGPVEQFFGFQKAPLKVASPETADKLQRKFEDVPAIKKKAREEKRGDR